MRTKPNRLPGARLICLAVGLAACGDASVVDGLSAAASTLQLLPDSVVVGPSQPQQFVATVRDAAGGVLDGYRLRWTSTGGSIDSMGVFRASSAGTYRVVANTSGGLADTAVVVVRDSAAPAPAPSAAPLASECDTPRAGWIWCDDFERDRLAAYFEYDAAGGRFVRAAGVGVAGSTGMRAVYATTPSSSAGFLHLAFGRTPQAYFRPVDAGTADHREIYWRVFLRLPSNWQGGGADKLSRATSFVSSTSWAQSMIAHVWSGYDAPSNQYLVLDPASGTDESGAVRTTTYNDFANLRWLGRQQGQTALFAPAGVGRWYCVEAHVRLNDAGLANGVFDLWIDGRLDASRSGLDWVGSYSTYGINAVFLENYWNSGSPVVQERYLDNLVVSTSRIGCGG